MNFNSSAFHDGRSLARLYDAPELVAGFARTHGLSVNTRVYAMEFPELDYAAFVPVNTNLPEWALGQYSVQVENVGKAAWQSGSSKDVPLADVKQNEILSQFDMIAIGYQWNLEELGKAMFMGVPLSERRAQAARMSAEQFIFENVLLGSKEKGWTGLLNNAAIKPAIAPATGTAATKSVWVLADGTGNKTPTQILSELNSLILGTDNIDTLGVAVSGLADTVLLPPRALKYIAETPFGESAPNKTILAFFLENNEYTRRTGLPVTVRDLPALSRTATSGITGGGRAVGYRNSEDVLSLPLPMPYRFLPAYQDGALNWVVPGIARVGELELIKPHAVRYLDGVTVKPA